MRGPARPSGAGARATLVANGSGASGRFVAAGWAAGGADGVLELTMARRCVASDDARAKWKLRELKACVLSAAGSDAAAARDEPWLALLVAPPT